MRQAHRSELLQDISTTDAATIRGGWWGYHLQNRPQSTCSTSTQQSCTTSSSCCNSSPGNSYDYGYGQSVNQTVEIHFVVD